MLAKLILPKQSVSVCASAGQLHVQHLADLLVHAQNADGLQVWPHGMTAVSFRQEASRPAGPAEVGCHCATSRPIDRCCRLNHRAEAYEVPLSV